MYECQILQSLSNIKKVLNFHGFNIRIKKIFEKISIQLTLSLLIARNVISHQQSCLNTYTYIYIHLLCMYVVAYCCYAVVNQK